MEGKTGSGSWSEHLHVEFDTDVGWPNYSPQVKGSNFIKKSPPGYPDTTVNPSDYFHRGENQIIADGSNPGWTLPADRNPPIAKDESLIALKNRISILTRENADLKKELADTKTEISLLFAKH